MKTLDENMIEDAIIRKRATLFIGGGAPKTFTRLYLYPALVEVAKSRNLNDVLNAYGYFMPIPVSPDHLEYKRGASHNEAYGIVSGGLLQRNLPKLWHLSIETYLPRDIYERTFHNWSQDREWSGEYTQQHFVDYINLIMQYKIPLAMYDSSSPERIRHNCEYWCIEQFNYKMLPHDDIDYTLDLIEWREPHVKLSEVEMKEVTQTPTGPSTRRGDGTALMVFGDNDSRVFNRGEVYDARVKLAFSTRASMTPLGYEKLEDLYSSIRNVLSGPYQLFNNTGWEADLRWDNATWENGVGRIPYRMAYSVPAITNEATVRNSIMRVLQSSVDNTLAKEMRKQSAITLSTNTIGYRNYGGYEASGDRVNAMAGILFDTLNTGERKALNRSNLHINAWCRLREIRRNVPLYTCKDTAKTTEKRVEGGKIIERGYIELKIVREKVWFEVMYVVSPMDGTKLETMTQKGEKNPRGDLYYDAKQSWLVPKQNTIRTSYKKYLATVLVNNGTRATDAIDGETIDEWIDKELFGDVPIVPPEITPTKENNLTTTEGQIKSNEDGSSWWTYSLPKKESLKRVNQTMEYLGWTNTWTPEE